ncbi:MAG: shikimate dehydrogenase [Candidatus Marinamargulisbacteria bacterium]
MTNHTSQNMNEIKQFAVIGNPIHHSKSPLIHNHFISQFNFLAEYHKKLIENHDQLAVFVNEIRSSYWGGINITIPHKQAIIPLLDEIDESVQIIGACNTVVNKSGKLFGYNTDSIGFLWPIRQRQFNKVIILGNGGAARAVLHQSSKQDWGEIVLVARNHEKSALLVNDLNKILKYPIKQLTFTDLNESELMRNTLVVNTTNMGMDDDDPVFNIVYWLNHECIFYDLIYTPWETNMMRVAQSNGAEVINGAPMLAAQAAAAFQLFFGKYPDVDTMIKLIKDAS